MKKLIETIKNIFKIEELRKRILFTLSLLLVYRFGSFVVIPGINPAALNDLQSQVDGNGLLGLLNIFSGGAFSNASIFALGIMPYISASIVIQLLGIVVPYFQKLQKEGESGRRKINQWTRYLTIIVLFWIMAIMDGWRGIKETWPAVIVAGGSFAIAQYLSSNFLGPELPDIISSLVSLVCLTLFLKRWQPVRIFRFGDLGASQVDMTLARTRYTAGQVIRAWSPFLFLTATVTLWSVPPFKALFAPGGAMYDFVINISVPFLDKMVARMPPVVSAATPYAAVYKFDWLSATGTAILFAALLSIVWLRMKPKDALTTFAGTLKDLALPIYSIGMVLASAFISNYSGLSSTLALALAHTGHAFTFFSPFLGWLGVFLTGSDTSSNALFAALQATAAQQIGVSDILLVAANTTGGVTGKMISPQSIAIACAAVGLVGKESDLFRFTVKHSLIFTCMVGLITTLQAYVLTWMIP